MFSVLVFLGLAMVCLTAFLVRRKSEFLMASQVFIITTIAINFYVMLCYMFHLVWIYLGLTMIGTLLIAIAKHCLNLRHNRSLNLPFSFVSELEQQFNVSVKMLDTQRTKAYTDGKRIFLSVGLLELLEKDEIRAVLAHEVYHLMNSPNRILTSLLALFSLTFLKYDDERLADQYAAEVAGYHNLSSALKKLQIKDYDRVLADYDRV